MADARALLQASRNERKIKHPHASYTSSGKLTCNLCETVIKHESAWQSHLHTTQHNLRQTRAREASTSRVAEGQSKKRKASDLDSPRVNKIDERKKARPAEAADSFDRRGLPIVEVAEEGELRRVDPSESHAKGSPLRQPGNAQDTAAELGELAEFERELAELEASVPTSNVVRADATVMSAPKTAAELAAEAREEQSAQRGKRDAELEGEKEDAARLLEDEFEEMEGLEQRARRLRERMEALRGAAPIGPDQGSLHRTVEKIHDPGRQGSWNDNDSETTVTAQNGTISHNNEDNDNDDEDDDNESDDYWTVNDR